MGAAVHSLLMVFDESIHKDSQDVLCSGCGWKASGEYALDYNSSSSPIVAFAQSSGKCIWNCTLSGNHTGRRYEERLNSHWLECSITLIDTYTLLRSALVFEVSCTDSNQEYIIS